MLLECFWYETFEKFENNQGKDRIGLNMKSLVVGELMVRRMASLIAIEFYSSF